MNTEATPVNVGSMEGLGRAVFEHTLRQWCPEHWTFGDDGTGGYHNHHTELAWIAWQAAREQSAMTCDRIAAQYNDGAGHAAERSANAIRAA